MARQGPVHLTEPDSSPSKRANATMVTGGRLMKCPPKKPLCLPRRPPSQPAEPTPSNRPRATWRRRYRKLPKRPSAGLPPLVTLQSVATGSGSVKREGPTPPPVTPGLQASSTTLRLPFRLSSLLHPSATSWAGDWTILTNAPTH